MFSKQDASTGIVRSPGGVNQFIKTSLVLRRRKSDLSPCVVCAHLYAGERVHTCTIHIHAYADSEQNYIQINLVVFNFITQFQ